MDIKDIIQLKDLEALEKLSVEELSKIFYPIYSVTRPEPGKLAPKTVAGNLKQSDLDLLRKTIGEEEYNKMMSNLKMSQKGKK